MQPCLRVPCLPPWLFLRIVDNAPQGRVPRILPATH